jgi:DNA-binding MarR family transcriptional regulator
MTTAGLARVALTKPQSMEFILASLEREGLIERRQHVTDRLPVLFVPTEEEVAVRRRHRTAKQDWVVAALGELHPTALQTPTAVIPAHANSLQRIFPQLGEAGLAQEMVDLLSTRND